MTRSISISSSGSAILKSPPWQHRTLPTRNADPNRLRSPQVLRGALAYVACQMSRGALHLREMYFVHALVDGMQKEIRLPFTNANAALEKACALIRDGAVDVSVQDGRGKNRIAGSDLAARCRGQGAMPALGRRKDESRPNLAAE